MKIDNMLHCDRFGVQKCRWWGPCWGIFLLLGAPRAAKSRTSRTATPFLLIFESVPQKHIFEEVERSIKNRFRVQEGSRDEQNAMRVRRVVRSEIMAP